MRIEPLYWIGAAGGRAWRRDPKPLSIIRSTCRFRRAVLRALHEGGQTWQPVLDAANYDNAIAAVRADIAISALQPSMVPAGLEIIASDELPALPAFAISLHRGSNALPDTAYAFAALLAEEMRSFSLDNDAGSEAARTKSRV